MKWPKVKISNGLAEVIRGVTFTKDAAVSEPRDGYIPILRAGNIGDSLTIDRDLVWIPKDLVSSDQLLRQFDTVVCTSSGSPKVVGKSANLESEFYGTCGAFNAIIRAKGALNPKYLSYWLQSDEYLAWRNRQATGANIQNIRHSALASIEVPLPAPIEQARIVEILDEADRLRRLSREASAKAERILPALFLKMFGDPATNPKVWPSGTLRDFGVKTRYGLGQPPKESASGLPLIRATNIDAGQITEKGLMYVDPAAVPQSRDALLGANEVLVVRSGAYTGDVAQVTDKWTGSVAGYDIVLTPPEGWYGEFLEQYLLTPFIQRSYFESQKTRAGQPHLNTTQLEQTPAYGPPEAIQRAFAERVRLVRVLRQQITNRHEALDSLFTLLLHKAFSGQLTAKWREAHMKELLAEMEVQARQLNLPMPQEAAV